MSYSCSTHIHTALVFYLSHEAGSGVYHISILEILRIEPSHHLRSQGVGIQSVIYASQGKLLRISVGFPPGIVFPCIEYQTARGIAVTDIHGDNKFEGEAAL